MLRKLRKDTILAAKSLDEKLEAVVLLGSMARGEIAGRNGIDVFVVLSDECSDMNPIERRK